MSQTLNKYISKQTCNIVTSPTVQKKDDNKCFEPLHKRIDILDWENGGYSLVELVY